MDAKLLKTFLEAYPAKMLKDTEGNETGIIVSMPCRVQWPHLAGLQVNVNKKTGIETSEYNVTLIVPKEADVSLLEAEGKRVGVAKFGQKAKALRDENKLGLRKQSSKAEFEGFEEEGFFMSSSTKFANFGPFGVGGKGDKIDPKEIYPGCWVIAKLQAYAFDFDGNKGVKFGLRGLQKIADDERLKEGSADPGDGFEAIAGAKKANGVAQGAADDAW